MDYVALRTALTGLPDDPAEAAAILSAQTVTVEVDVKFADARAVLYHTAEFGGLRVAYDDATTPRPLKAVIWTALDAFGSERSIIAGDTAGWTAALSMLGALCKASMVSQASIDSIVALRTATMPAWPKAIIKDDVISARSLP